jgi:transposase
MQALDEKEKKQLVIELYRQNKTIREIAEQVHMSFGDVGKIIRSLDDRNDDVDENDGKQEQRYESAISTLDW